MNKLTSGTFRLELGTVDIGAALDGAIQSLQPAAIAKGVAVTTIGRCRHARRARGRAPAPAGALEPDS